MSSPSAIGHRTGTPGCLVEQAVNAAMGDGFSAAEALLPARLGHVTLASLSADLHARMVDRASHYQPENKTHAA